MRCLDDAALLDLTLESPPVAMAASFSSTYIQIIRILDSVYEGLESNLKYCGAALVKYVGCVKLYSFLYNVCTENNIFPIRSRQPVTDGEPLLVYKE